MLLTIWGRYALKRQIISIKVEDRKTFCEKCILISKVEQIFEVVNLFAHLFCG